MKRLTLYALAVVGAGTLVATSAVSSSGQGVAIVRLQATTPGTSQTGNLHISGTGIFGGIQSGSAVFTAEPDNIDLLGFSPWGVRGYNPLSTNTSVGVLGDSDATTGTTWGVVGQSDSTGGRGVGGYANAATGVTYGIYGQVTSANGYSGYFTGGKGVLSIGGVEGQAFTGVTGLATAANGNGVAGTANGGTNAWGVHGQSNSGQGVVGQAGASVGGGFPALTGVVARSTGTSGYGLYAENTNLANGRAAYLNGKLQVVDGTQAAGTVLVGNASGVASWQTAASLGASNNWTSLWTLSGSNLYPNSFATWLTGLGTSAPAARLHVNDLALATNGEALRVTYGGTSTLTEGVDIVATPWTGGTGTQHGLAANASVSGVGAGANSAGTSSAVLANASAFFAQGAFNGISATSTTTTLDNFAGSNVSTATGGNFSSNVNNIALGSLGTYWLGGSYSVISGAVNSTPPAGAISAVIGIDNVTGTAPHWAGYFQGRGYFAGNVGIGTTTPGTALDINGTGRMTGFQLPTGAVANYVLTSNGSGVGTWQASAAGFSLPFTGSANTKAAGNFCNAVFEVDTTAGNTFTAICGRTNGSVNGVPGGDSGVHGISVGIGSNGVLGESTGASTSKGVAGYSGSGIGVYGLTATASGYGVYGTAPVVPNGVNWINGPSGVFSNGQLGGTGTKPFRIDHPADPLNKYLFHFSAEGPKPLNIYTGTVVTDKKGQAWVELPTYYEDINKDPQYQLTVVDDTAGPGFVQVKVAKKIKGNRFMVMTSAPEIEVCWEVKATRNDRWVQKYGAVDEVDKPESEKGKYQRPELYGAPPEMGIDFKGRGVVPARPRQ